MKMIDKLFLSLQTDPGSTGTFSYYLTSDIEGECIKYTAEPVIDEAVSKHVKPKS